MKIDIYKDHYQFEWDHRSHLTSALNIPIAVTTVIGGALTIMIQSFLYHNDLATYFFIGLNVLTIISIVLAVFFVFKSLHGYKYQRIPTPKKLKKHYDDLVKWHVTYGDGMADAKKEFKQSFHEGMAEAVEINAHNNKSKSAYIYRANVALATSLLFLAFSSVPFLVKTVGENEKIHLVRIIEMPQTKKEVHTMTEDDQAEQPETTVNLPTAPPPKPTFPPNEQLKEHKIPPLAAPLIQEEAE